MPTVLTNATSPARNHPSPLRHREHARPGRTPPPRSAPSASGAPLRLRSQVELALLDRVQLLGHPLPATAPDLVVLGDLVLHLAQRDPLAVEQLIEEREHVLLVGGQLAGRPVGLLRRAPGRASPSRWSPRRSRSSRGRRGRAGWRARCRRSPRPRARARRRAPGSPSSGAPGRYSGTLPRRSRASASSTDSTSQASAAIPSASQKAWSPTKRLNRFQGELKSSSSPCSKARIPASPSPSLDAGGRIALRRVARHRHPQLDRRARRDVVGLERRLAVAADGLALDPPVRRPSRRWPQTR